MLLKSKFLAPAICFPIHTAQELPLAMTQLVVVAIVVFLAFASILLTSLFILFVYTLLSFKLSTESCYVRYEFNYYAHTAHTLINIYKYLLVSTGNGFLHPQNIKSCSWSSPFYKMAKYFNITCIHPSPIL